jgi:hypothetical protein
MRNISSIYTNTKLNTSKKIACRYVCKKWRKDLVLAINSKYSKKTKVNMMIDKCCYFYHLVDRILYKFDSNKKSTRYVSYEWVNISTELIYRVFNKNEWTEVRDFLIANDLICWNKSYFVGELSQRYSIPEKYFGCEIVTHYFNNPGSQMRKLFEKENLNVRERNMREGWNLGLENIGFRDWEAVMQIYERNLSRIKTKVALELSELDKKKIYGDRKKKKQRSIKCAITSYQQQLKILIMIKEGIWYCNRCEWKRFHSNLTRLDSDFDEYLYDKKTGDTLVEIDLACSQPSFQYLTLLEIFDEKHPEMIKFRQYIENDIYTQFVGENTSVVNRKELKQSFFKDYLYGPIQDNEISRKFRKEFPEINEYWESLKRKTGKMKVGDTEYEYHDQIKLSKNQPKDKHKVSYSLPAQMMQLKESNCFIDNIAKAVSKINGITLVGTVHDSIKIPKRFADKVIKIIANKLIEMKLEFVKINIKDTERTTTFNVSSFIDKDIEIQPNILDEYFEFICRLPESIFMNLLGIFYQIYIKLII